MSDVASPTRFARRSAVAFGLLWLVAVTTSPSLEGAQVFVQLAVLLAIGCLVPLGQSLYAPNSKLLYLHPIGAGAAFGALYLPQGLAAAALSAIWLLYTFAWAFLGLRVALSSGLFGLRSKMGLDVAAVSRSAALAYLPVGAGWLLLFRAGINPMDFVDLVVLLTALHFHFAGFCAPLLLGLAGRHLQSGSTGVAWTFRISALAVISGSPLLAIGFTMSPPIEFMGASFIALGISAVSLLSLGKLRFALTSAFSRTALTISSLCGLVGMALAVYYAVGELLQVFTISIPQMARLHGVVNALGFSLFGLLGWTASSDSDQNKTESTMTR